LPAKARYNPMGRARRPGTNGSRLHPKSAGRSRVAVGGGPRRQEMASQELARIELGEADLILRALRHDEAAIRTIIRQNNRRLFRLARGMTGSDDEAEDIVQAAYVRAFTRLASFRRESSLATWLSRIVINEALGRIRRDHPTV